MKSLVLTQQDKEDLVEFIHALTSHPKMPVLPILPKGSIAQVQHQGLSADKNEIVAITK